LSPNKRNAGVPRTPAFFICCADFVRAAVDPRARLLALGA
jgi:hypothetical protein